MVTDDERREIAAKLREKKKERDGRRLVPQMVGLYLENCLHDLEDCLPDGESMFTILSDLIDRPHCRIVQDKDGVWECTSCGAAIDWDAGDEPPNCAFCPNCGAEVARDASQ